MQRQIRIARIVSEAAKVLEYERGDHMLDLRQALYAAEAIEAHAAELRAELRAALDAVRDGGNTHA